MYSKENFLTLDKDAQNQFSQFAPDAVLKVTVASKVSTRIIYQVNLVDRKNNSILWDARVDMNPAGSFAPHVGPNLAKQILEKMKTDNLISQSCQVDEVQD